MIKFDGKINGDDYRIECDNIDDFEYILDFAITHKTLKTSMEESFKLMEEAQEEKRKPISQTTQGKKGKKLPRINMAFSIQNLEYLQIISRVEGISITEYVNRLVEADKESRKDIVKQAKKIFKGANK